METVVYADLLFLVNFSMDYLCLFVTSRLLHRRLGGFRGVIAAFLGGCYSVAVLFFKMSTVTSIILDVLFCAFICLVAFKTSEGVYKYFITISVYFGVSVGIGGLMTGMFSFLNRIDLPLDEVRNNGDGISVWLFALLAVISGVAAIFGGNLFKTSSVDSVYNISLRYRGCCKNIKGMVDTGNLLKDPISGKPIIIIDINVAGELLSPDCAIKASKGDISAVVTADPLHKVRLVPTNTATGSASVCAFVPDEILISAEKNNGEVASKINIDALFAPAELSVGAEKKAWGCGALIPPSLI